MIALFVAQGNVLNQPEVVHTISNCNVNFQGYTLNKSENVITQNLLQVFGITFFTATLVESCTQMCGDSCTRFLFQYLKGFCNIAFLSCFGSQVHVEVK